MTLFNIIPTIFSVFGCVANSFCLTYFLLYERKGLTNKLFILLSMWDFWNSAVVTARIWTPLSAWIVMQPLYMWVTNMNHYVLVTIAWTRMVKICSPFYRIKEKAVWIAMLANILYWSTVPVTFNIKGDFTAIQIFHLGGWQLAKFIHDVIGAIIFLLLVLFPNIVSGIKLSKPGNVVISERNAKAAKTIMIISVIFIFSNILVYLTIARNIKFLIQKNVEPLIPGFNHLLGAFFFRLLWLLNTVCDPIVFFIRNKNLRDWVMRVPYSIKNQIFSKILRRSTNQSKAEENDGRSIEPSRDKTVVNNERKIEPSPGKTVVNYEGNIEPSLSDKNTANNEGNMEPPAEKNTAKNEGNMEPPAGKNTANNEGNMEPPSDKNTAKNEGNMEPPADKNTANNRRNMEPPTDKNTANNRRNMEPPTDKNTANNEGNKEPPADRNTAKNEANMEPPADKTTANNEGNIEPSLSDKNTANNEGNMEPPADKNVVNNGGNMEPLPGKNTADYERHMEPPADKTTANNEGNIEPLNCEGNNELPAEKNISNNGENASSAQ